MRTLTHREKLLVAVLVLTLCAVSNLWAQYNKTKAFDISTTATTLLVSAGGSTASTQVTTLALAVTSGGTTGQTVQFMSCTSNPCTTGFTAISQAFSSGSGTVNFAFGPGGGSPAIVAPQSADLYVQATAAVRYTGHVTYIQTNQ